MMHALLQPIMWSGKGLLPLLIKLNLREEISCDTTSAVCPAFKMSKPTKQHAAANAAGNGATTSLDSSLMKHQENTKKCFHLRAGLASMRRILLLLPKLLLHKLMLLRQRQRLHCKILELWSSKTAISPERSFHFLDSLSKFVIGMYKLRIQSLMRFARVVLLQFLVKRACFFL